MKYSNELKVGLAILAAAAIFFFGVRFFAGLPIFGGGYELYTQLATSDGIVSGNAVTINGVKVGAVERVTLDSETQQVNVRFRLREDVHVPRGTYASVAGLGALGSVRLNLELGPPGNPPVDPGSRIPGRSTGDVVERLTNDVPELVGHADSVLVTAESALGAARRLLTSPESDLRQTLDALRRSAEELTQLLREQETRLTQVLENAEAFTGDLRRFTDENADSLGVAVDRLNASLAQLRADLSLLESTIQNLNTITARIARGEGTLGKLVNDPSLYAHLDSAAVRLNRILADFEHNPQRYLEALSLVEVF